MGLSLINPKQHKQLFLDNYSVEKTFGIKQSFHPPKKCGPIISPDRSRGQTSLQSRSVPQWNSDKNIWEWWYWASTKVPSSGGSENSSRDIMYYATSTDGENWERPALGFHDWNGSKDNNIAFDPNAGSRPIYHIIRDEQEKDPSRRYKGLFNAHNRFLGVSPNGFQWEMLDVPPIPSQDESHFTYDEISGQYIAMIKLSTQWGRSVWLSTSKDFVHFSEPKLIFNSDEIDWQNCRQRVREVIENPDYITPPVIDGEDYIAEVYQMAVLPYEGVYLGFPCLFNPFGAISPPHMNFDRINQVELAISRDLYHWNRVADRALFIGLDTWNGENYGTSQNLMCGRPIIRPDLGEIWVYYNALRMPGSKELFKEFNSNAELYRLNVDPDLFNDAGALSLAKIRLDGFVSMDAEKVGWIITKPFMLNGEDLYINADAKWGEIHAEILDAENVPLDPQGAVGPDTFDALPGFVGYKGQTIPFNGDELCAKMAWKDSPNLSFEKPVRIRFILHRARLYSFWLE